MESGLKQMEAIEDRLVQIIRIDKESSDLKLQLLEVKSIAHQKNLLDVITMISSTSQEDQHRYKKLREAQFSHYTRIRDLESKESIIDFSMNEVAKLVNPEPPNDFTIADDHDLPVASPVSDWISRVCYNHGRGPYAELHAEIGVLPMDGPPLHLTHRNGPSRDYTPVSTDDEDTNSKQPLTQNSPDY